MNIIFYDSSKQLLNPESIFFLAIFSVLKVQVFTYFWGPQLELVYYDDNYLNIDGWTLIHIVNNLLLVYTLKRQMTFGMFLFLVIGWEILENLIVPYLCPQLSYFKEPFSNIITDILTSVPALLYYVFS